MVDPGNLVKADRPRSPRSSRSTHFTSTSTSTNAPCSGSAAWSAKAKIKSPKHGRSSGPRGLSDEEDYPHKGLIDFSDNRVDPSTGTLRLRARIDNPQIADTKTHLLSPGLFMQGPPAGR